MLHLDRYRDLLDGYQQGIYTRREVVGQTFDMLVESTDRETLWQTLTPEHREEIAGYLTNYDEAVEPPLRHPHWQRVMEETIALKRWFEGR